MIRSFIKTCVVSIALLGLVTGGWACGIARADANAAPQGLSQASDDMPGMPGGDQMPGMPGNAMKDCKDSGTAMQSPCLALCAVTLSVTPSLSPQVAVEIGVALYPSAPALRDWLIPPDPYPPRT